MKVEDIDKGFLIRQPTFLKSFVLHCFQPALGN